MAVPREAKAPELPRRLFLVSVPRTASNLLVKVLGVQQQPNIYTNHKCGYFFQDGYLAAVAKGYHNKPLSEWTPSQKSEILSIYQSCLDQLESAASEARSQNKIFFTKEHAFWFANPSTIVSGPPSSRLDDHEELQVAEPLDTSFRLRLPPSFGLDPSSPGSPQQTFSPQNKTIFPDAYLSAWQFAFIIRHPALAWPSMYRAMIRLADIRMLDGDQGVRASAGSNMTWRWTRWLFDWCCENQEQSQQPPVIIDAHDVIHEPEVVLKFCDITGLDRSLVRFEWGDASTSSGSSTAPRNVGGDHGIAEAAGKGQKPGGNEVLDGELLDEAVRIMTDTLRASKGVIKEKTPAEVDVDAEREKWKEEFGAEVAEWLAEKVVAEMPDYEYLRDRRLRA